MGRTTLLTLGCCLLLAATSLAETKTVVLKDGRRITGEVIETAAGYEVRTKLGVVIFDKDQVESVTEAFDPVKEYESRLAKIDTESAADQFALAQWAFDTGLAERAAEHLREALRLEPGHKKAALLLKQIEAGAAAEEPASRPVDVTPPDGTGPTVRSEWLMPQEDIYRVRLEELRRDADRAFTVDFRNKVVERFIEQMKGIGDFRQPRFADRFQGYSRVAKVYYMLDKIESHDTAIKDDILVKSDPQFMIEFRSRIWPLVGQYCASTHCHGAEKPKGGLKLFNVKGERADYTNFVILDLLKLKGGKRLINRDDPQRSLILQYGLKPEQARYSHQPKLPTPLYASEEDAKYRRVEQWIRSLRADPTHPDYRLSYKPPLGMELSERGLPELPPATPPSTQPATKGDTDEPDVPI